MEPIVNLIIRGVHWGLLFLSLAVSPIALSAQIHLEHSLYHAEGSLWGTEDAFKKNINLPASKIPLFYRIPYARNILVHRVSVKDIPQAQGRFLGDEVVLLKQLNVCLSSQIPPFTNKFTNALNGFLNGIAGHPDNGRLMNISFYQVNWPSASSLSHCDLMFVQGSWNSFPYKYIHRKRESKLKPWQEQVYGIYYRHAKTALPIVTIHPDISLTYDPPGGRYVTWIDGRLLVDGNVLILHELGHYLGFSHLGGLSSSLSRPELTVMGLISSFRKRDSNYFRFSQANNIWRYWDAYQTTIYRQWLWREFHQ